MNLMKLAVVADYYFLTQGRGEDVLGFMETLVDRLFQFIGGKEQKYVNPLSPFAPQVLRKFYIL